MTPAIIDIGRDLLVAKQTLPHGRFLPWVKAECGFAPRTAQNYMRVAEFADGKCETVSLLTPTAIYALSSKKAPPVVVHQVLQLLESNRVPTNVTCCACSLKHGSSRLRRSQLSNARLNAQEADDLASRLLGSIGRDFARSSLKDLGTKLVSLCARSFMLELRHPWANAAPQRASASMYVDLERDPHVQIYTARKPRKATAEEFLRSWTGDFGLQAVPFHKLY